MSGWRVQRDPFYGCEIWLGKVNSNGYPTIWEGGRPRQAYYVALERAGIVVPPDKEPDHLCRRRLCVAFPHLEVVSRIENQRRKFWHYRALLTSCSKGHDLKVHGRRTPEGGTICRICSNVWKPTGPEPELE